MEKLCKTLQKIDYHDAKEKAIDQTDTLVVIYLNRDQCNDMLQDATPKHKIVVISIGKRNHF